METTKAPIELLDGEWIQLILKAKKMGIGKEEIREFLLKSGEKGLSLKVAE